MFSKARGHFTLIKSDVLILFVFRQMKITEHKTKKKKKSKWKFFRFMVDVGLSLCGDFHFTEIFKTPHVFLLQLRNSNTSLPVCVKTVLSRKMWQLKMKNCWKRRIVSLKQLQQSGRLVGRRSLSEYFSRFPDNSVWWCRQLLNDLWRSDEINVLFITSASLA